MSAPKEGRNSPPPSEQSGAQQQSAPGSGHLSSSSAEDVDSGKSQGQGQRRKGQETGNQQASDDSKVHGLESNPKGPLEDAAREKLSKNA